MALRKQKIIDIPSESQHTEEDSQEDVAADGQDKPSSSLLATSSARGKRQKEDKSKPKEMTEEEMMDLALRLSEQEASVTALRRQQEEEAVMKAIEESMVGQTQPCWTSQSPSQPVNASLGFCSRRKLAYSNGKKNPDIDRGTSEDGCTPAGTRDDDTRNVRRKRKAGSPLPEMPDLSQTQKIYSQASPCSSESPLALPDSPQSSDSTQIEDSQLRRSPVFPLTGCRAEIRIDRLSQDLLDTCRSSGFVLCTQDSLNSPQKSTRPKSPTFPASSLASGPKSSVLSGADPSDSEPSPESVRSTASGRNIPHERSACKPGDSASSQARENSGFTFSSQESLTPSVRPTSPVFPRSPSIAPSELLAFPKGPDRAQTEPSHARAVSPVFGPQKKSGSPAERRGPSGARRDGRGRVDGLKASESEEPSRRSKSPNRAETEPSSSMMLVWTDEDEDDDVTMSFQQGHSSSNARLAPPHRLQPTGSPSPVFPEETSILHAESPAASRNHVASSSGMTGPKCSLNPQKVVKDQSSSYKHASLETSPKSSGGEHPSPTEQELQPAGSDSWTGPQSGAAGSTTVHYYWGVPFCPRGLDPDTYTQVIVAQMEAYEKSLKRAQRRLLRKAEWGEAVLPQPEKSPPHESPAGSPQHHGPRRRGLRLRNKSQNEAADSPTAEEEEEEEGKKDEEEPRKMENKEEEEKDKGDEEQMDAEECQVCPETPPSGDDASQDLTLLPEAEARPGAKSPEFPELQMILHRDSPARNEPQEEEAEGATGEKMEGDVPVSSSDGGAEEVKEDSRGPDVEEIKGRRPQRAASPEEEPAIIPRSPETAVDCPICQASFPASRIEMHAAYCDGEVAVVEERRPAVDCIQVSLKPRRKRTRRANAEETNDHCDVSSRNQEKCYICQKDVALKDYCRHTELCITGQGSKTAPVSPPHSAVTHLPRGNLLLALDQTESRDSDAGPSGSKLLSGDVIDLRDDDDDDDDDEVSAFRVSNSPIRSFTSISEATDCLIDFKKQQRAKKPCQRRR